MGTAVDRASAVDALHLKAAAYNMRNQVIEEGHNVLKVYQSVNAAVAHARRTYEPSLLEVQTFRYRGHSMSDPIHGHYRTKEEVEAQKKLDPLTMFAEILTDANLASESYFDSAEERVKIIVDECVAFTENSPEPPLEELYTDIYAE
jgi:pyruvate dehydrogenase E1 component alpha subunit